MKTDELRKIITDLESVDKDCNKYNYGYLRLPYIIDKLKDLLDEK